MRAKSLFTIVLAMAFIATVLVPMTSEAKYRKRVLPKACSAETTEEIFWADKKVTGSGEEKELFFVVMAAMDPYTGGEYVVAEAKWGSLCDSQRKAYKVWLESVVRTGVYLVFDYLYSGPEIFGGKSYPDENGDTETLDPMSMDSIADLLLQPSTRLDVIAAGRPGTPHSGGTLGGFTSNVCRLTGTNCPPKKKAAAPKAKVSGSSPAGSGATGSSSSGSAGSPPATPTEEKCSDGTPKPCPPPAEPDAPPAELDAPPAP